jgi:type II secretory pathway pseudopilin PulG
MTLPEVMIASSILLVCLTALAALLGTSVTSSSLAKMRDEAANLANDRIESARSFEYDRVGTKFADGSYGDPAGDILTPETVGRFVVTTECRWIRTASGRAAYKQVTVHVAWQQPVPGEVEITTMIYGKSDIVTSGDLLVRMRYREDATPVQNATVSILTSDNSLRSVNTDAAGDAFFGQASIGPVALTITPPAGCVVDTSTMSSSDVAADSVTTLIVYVQQPAQATVTVKDTSGAPVAGATVTARRSDGAILPALDTDANGTAVFSQLLYADYSVTVTKAGYSSSTVPFNVSVGAADAVVPVTVSPLLGVGIRVRVFDASSTQLSGSIVTVRVGGTSTVLQSGVAGSNGEISFDGLTAGTFDVTVDKSGYVSQVRSTYLYDGDLDTLDYWLSPVATTGNMHIVTRNKWGNLASIRVKVDGPGFYRDDLWSDINGNLTISNLVPGSYRVRAYTKATSTATVIINGGQTADVAISQKP